MTDTIEYEQFDQSAQPAGSAVSGADMSRLSDIPMELSVEIGRTHMTVGETLQLRVGSVVTLERLAGEPVDLLVNGSAIARGEVVVVDEQFGMRITEILEGDADDPAATDMIAVTDSGVPASSSESADARGDAGDPAIEPALGPEASDTAVDRR